MKDKEKLGKILSTVGLIGFLSSFVIFPLTFFRGGMPSFQSMGTIFLIPVISMIIIIIGGALRGKKNGYYNDNGYSDSRIRHTDSVNENVKFCPYCGTENNKEASYCQKCGKEIMY